MDDEGVVISTAGVTDLAQLGERDLRLSEATVQALHQSVPANTKRAYDDGWARFVAWCETEIRTPLPATRETLTEYVRQLTESVTEAGQPVSPSSIEQVVAIVRSKHTEAGYRAQPDTFHALRLLKSYRRDRAEAGWRARKAPPITAGVLRALIRAVPPVSARARRNRLLLVVGFNMMARRSELAALNISELHVDGDDLVVFVRASKTDQEARGREVRLPRGQRAETCPIQLHAAWLNDLAEGGVNSGRLFRSVNRHGKIGESLTGDSINRIIHEVCKRAEIDLPVDWDRYTAHSLRAGGATQARKNGAHMVSIAEHGGWNPRSPVVYGYVRDEDDRSSNVMRGSDL